MAVAQGINTQINIVKQSALGSPGSSGSKTRRRVTAIFKATPDTVSSSEIVTHQQSTGATATVKKPSGKLNGEMSPATYSQEIAAIFRKDFASGATTGSLTNITVASSVFTRASGSFLTDGFKLFDVVRWTGLATSADNATNMLITALTATTMTLVKINGASITNDASAGETVACTVVGKKSIVPTTGHTNDYFSVEVWNADLTDSQFYTDAKPSKIDISIPGTGVATIGVDWVALGRSIGGTQILTSPTAETTTPVLHAANGLVYINGVVYPVTGINISIDGSTTHGDIEVGTNTLADTNRGRVLVSGSFTALQKDQVVQALFEARTPVSIVGLLFDNKAVIASSFATFVMTRCKIMDDAPDDGEKQIVMTFPFTAEIDTAGGAALANNQTIISCQDSDA